MDVNPILSPIAFCIATIFSGAVEVGKIEQALDAVTRGWPVLGARVRFNEQTGKIEMLIPDVPSVRLKATSKQIDSTLAQTKLVHIKTRTISTQVIVRDPSMYRSRPLQNLQAHIESGEPIWSLHITYLKDSTILAFTLPHFMDAGGLQDILHALIGAMDGKPIPPPASQHPWSTLLTKARLHPSHPDLAGSWSVWDGQSVEEFQQEALSDIQAIGPLQSRNIYFPATEIMRLKQQAMEDIINAGYNDVKWLSTSDVISAWFYQHMFIDLPDSEATSRFMQFVNLRKHFPEVFPPDHSYPRQAILPISTSQLTDTQLNSMSYGEIARMVRLSVDNNAARMPLLTKLKWVYEHEGKFVAPFNPADRLQGLMFRFGELDISRHVTESTGTGRVVEMIGEASGKGYINVLKFKDADGGVVCEMDWGVKRWTSGEIAKYALDDQSAAQSTHYAVSGTSL
ncbi:hypothetical protein RhiJN_03400 [Ceratobasidium sp. AG-Ba]|nr:hypothetical protein RhiJN_03400 [Ceratobasidium sp. AG-Ba]